MRFLLLIALVVLLFASCSEKARIPPGILTPERMKTIVWEMEIADQTATEKFVLRKDSLRMESTSLYQQVFTKYKTDKPTFYKSFSFYESHPDLLKVLFDSVNNYGNRQKAAAYKKAY